MAILFIVFFLISACQNNPPEQATLKSDSATVQSITWNVQFKSDTADIIKELVLFSIEKTLADSVSGIIKGLNKDAKFILSRIQFPMGSRNNFQIKLEFSGNDAKYFLDHPVSLNLESMGFPMLGGPGIIPYHWSSKLSSSGPIRLMPLDTIIIRRSALAAMISLTNCKPPCTQ